MPVVGVAVRVDVVVDRPDLHALLGALVERLEPVELLRAGDQDRRRGDRAAAAGLGEHVVELAGGLGLLRRRLRAVVGLVPGLERLDERVALAHSPDLGAVLRARRQLELRAALADRMTERDHHVRLAELRGVHPQVHDRARALAAQRVPRHDVAHVAAFVLVQLHPAEVAEDLWSLLTEADDRLAGRLRWGGAGKQDEGSGDCKYDSSHDFLKLGYRERVAVRRAWRRPPRAARRSLQLRRGATASWERWRAISRGRDAARSWSASSGQAPHQDSAA